MKTHVTKPWWPLLAVLAYLGTLTLLAQAPAWWTNRSVIATNVVARDFSPLNQGQLKWLATRAAVEFDAQLEGIGGAGTGVTALVAGFSTNHNFRPVNAGQLKNTAAVFYDRLFALGLTNCYPQGAGTPYPWSGSTNTVRDYSLVNVGQAKYLFSFDLSNTSAETTTDSDGDGLPDWWEEKYFGTRTGASPQADSDGDGVNNLTEYIQGRNPLAGVTNDVNQQLALVVFTPL